jgi:protein-tyrosine phosphatase
MDTWGMVDIHAHILPGLDDGPRDWQAALDMCQVALSQEISTIVATPHIMAEVFDNSAETILPRLEELQKRLTNAGIDLTVLPGSEVHLDVRILEWLKNGRVLTLNRGRYLLLELPTAIFPPYLEQFSDHLLASGVVPVIAHAERNLSVQTDPNQLYPLVQRGVLAQITAQSLTGDFGRSALRCAEILLQCRLCHVIATDAHSTTGRPPIIEAGVEKAQTLVGPLQAYAMVTSIPGAIVRNEPVDVDSPERYLRRFGWFS